MPVIAFMHDCPQTTEKSFEKSIRKGAGLKGIPETSTERVGRLYEFAPSGRFAGVTWKILISDFVNCWPPM